MLVADSLLDVVEVDVVYLLVALTLADVDVLLLLLLLHHLLDARHSMMLW